MIAQQLFKHCPVCGKTAFKFHEPNCLKCKKCTFEFYINPVPCNGLLIFNKKNEVLLAKRKASPYKGRLDIPGGFVNPGETYSESVVREVKEELGIDIKVTDLEHFSELSGKYTYKKLTFPTIGIVYIIHKRFELEELKPQDDITELQFVPVDNIPYDKIGFPCIRYIYRTLAKLSKSKKKSKRVLLCNNP